MLFKRRNEVERLKSIIRILIDRLPEKTLEEFVSAYLNRPYEKCPDYIEQMFIKRNKGDIIYPNILWWYRGYQQNRFEEIGRITPKQQLKVNRVLVTSLMKKEVFYKVGGFRDLPIYEDWDFWYRATKKGYSVKVIPEILFYYRKHGRSMVDEAISNHNKILDYILTKDDNKV